MTRILKPRLLAVAAIAAALCCHADVAPLRIAYNYCTLSYTFAYYSNADWAKW